MPAVAKTLSKLSFNTMRALPARRLLTPGPAAIFSDVPPTDTAPEPTSALDAGAGAAGAATADGFDAEEPTTRRLTEQRATCGANPNGLLLSSVVPVITLPFT